MRIKFNTFRRASRLSKQPPMFAEIRRQKGYASLVQKVLVQKVKGAFLRTASLLVPMAFRPLGRSGPIVVARRSDRLGGRLGAMLNALSISDALKLEFRFVWPNADFSEINDPGELFDSSFIARYRCSNRDFVGRRVIRAPINLSLEDAREYVRRIGRNVIFDVSECFEILSFQGEDQASAHVRFNDAMRKIGWSDGALSLISTIYDRPPVLNYSAIHIRAGDIAVGDWRQFVPVDKYLPTFYVEFAIGALSASGSMPVVIFSDNADYLAYLKGRLGVVHTSDVFFKCYSELTDLQRAFADILALSRAQSIVGPNSSAFSRVAANLNSMRVVGIDQLATKEEAMHLLRSGIESFKGHSISGFLRPLIARDICWFLNVFGEDISLDERASLSAQAVQLESDFCGGLNHFALSKAMTGEPEAALEAISRSYQAAVEVNCHSDPLVETLATSVSAAILEILSGSPVCLEAADSTIENNGGCMSISAQRLDELEMDLERCAALQPFQIHHDDVLLNLRFQLTALQWINVTSFDFREALRSALQLDMHDASFMSTWRPSGFSKLRETGSFPQVLRNIEEVTIRIVRALSTALSGSSMRPAGNLYLDAVQTTASGMRWVRGWTSRNAEDSGQLAVGYFSNGACISSGVSFLAHVDLSRAMTALMAFDCPFALPIPLEEPKNFSSISENFRIISYI